MIGFKIAIERYITHCNLKNLNLVAIGDIITIEKCQYFPLPKHSQVASFRYLLNIPCG